MSLRSFTVFQDTPSTDVSLSKATAKPTILSPSSSASVTSATTLTNLTSITEKENVHPLTGERAGPGSSNASKKRKTSVLATKVHMPMTMKKQKESKESKPETKKRKPSTSTSSASKGKSTGKKDTKSSGSARKATRRSPRKLSSMPKVDEEDAEAERERARITQADVDSRCYELTVQPLADVSQAYDQSPVLECSSPDEKTKVRSAKETSAEPELRDYFSPSLVSSLPSSSKLPISGSSPKLSQEAKAFSTPERKQIYAAFTFSSPSPTSERFNKATRATSVPRLQINGIESNSIPNPISSP